MATKIVSYLRGLGLTFLAIIVFSSVGWINIGTPFDASKIVIPFLMACTIWTAMYFFSYAVWTLLLLFTGCTFGIGFFIGFGILGYAALRLTAYVFPVGWMTFSQDELQLLLMGFSIAFIDIVADKDRHNKISISVGNDDGKDDDEDDDDEDDD